MGWFKRLIIFVINIYIVVYLSWVMVFDPMPGWIWWYQVALELLLLLVFIFWMAYNWDPVRERRQHLGFIWFVKLMVHEFILWIRNWSCGLD